MDDDDRYTPLPGLVDVVRREVLPLSGELRRIESQCTGRHERTGKAIAELRKGVSTNTEARIEMGGKSGKNGMIGEVRDDIRKLETEQERQRRMIWRLAFAMFGASASGAAAAHALLQAL